MRDPIMEKIDKHLNEAPRKPEPMSPPMTKMRIILSSILKVDEGDIRREHISRFVNGTPDHELLRHRGIGPVALKKLREELKGSQP